MYLPLDLPRWQLSSLCSSQLSTATFFWVRGHAGSNLISWFFSGNTILRGAGKLSPDFCTNRVPCEVSDREYSVPSRVSSRLPQTS